MVAEECCIGWRLWHWQFISTMGVCKAHDCCDPTYFTSLEEFQCIEICSDFCKHTHFLDISKVLIFVRLFFVGYEFALLIWSLRDIRRIHKAKNRTY